MRHVRLNHEPRDVPVKCPRTWCTREFEVLKEMKDHKKDCFKRCEDSPRTYSRMDKYLSHLRFHTNMKMRMM